VNHISDKILVIDLDGTLLRSDMLHESFWSALSHNWKSLFYSATALFKGRASLKHYLAKTADIDPQLLPYDSQVISYIEKWRDNGGRTALVTASDQIYAQSIAEHLGIFDEAHGSDGRLNLKGNNKAKFLKERFGRNGFFYMADGTSDLPTWGLAAKAITVNAPMRLRYRVEHVSKKTEHLSTTTRSIKHHIKTMRPHQWLKNMLVFLPLFAAHQYDNITLLISLLAFISFSLVASSVYILNDLLDLAADRIHPRKKYRPFASGSIPITHGIWLIACLMLFGSLLSINIGVDFALLMAWYFILTTAYSLRLKQYIVIDICLLAGLYTMRIIAGGIATTILISEWLLAFSTFFFLSLAAVKRQSELVDSSKRGHVNTSGRGYHVDDLPIIPMIAVGSGYVSVLVMALYLNSPIVTNLYSNPRVLWGVCAVLLYWITRVVVLAHRGNMHDDPLVFAVNDRVSQLCFLIIIALVWILA